MSGRHGWFADVFGFDEGSYAQTRAQFSLADDGRTLVCPSGRIEIGPFALPSVRELAEQLQPLPPASERLLRFEHVRGDVRSLHRACPGAVFQAASQFNCLEMVGPKVSPSDGITGYVDDATQGPACALSCPGALAFRNFLVNGHGQGGTGRQLDLLADAAELLDNKAHKYWTMQNGYCLPGAGGLRALNSRLRADPQLVDRVRQSIRVGIHWETAVHGAPREHKVCQVYSSAMPVAYGKSTPVADWEPLSRIALEASFEATLSAAAVLAAQRNDRVVVYLTEIGGGAFGNMRPWIAAALRRALLLHLGRPLDVKLLHYMGLPPSAYAGLEADLAAAGSPRT